jgi:hypothetical protein
MGTPDRRSYSTEEEWRKEMNEAKTLGAKEMFRQSIVYLYNSYREGGQSAADAKANVAKDVEAIYEEYVDSGAMPPRKSLGIADPIRVINETLEHVRKTGDVELRDGKEQTPFKFRVKLIIQNLQHLKKLLQ